MTLRLSLLFILLLFTVAIAEEQEEFLRFLPNTFSSLPTSPVPQISRTLFVSSWNAQGRAAAIQHAGLFDSVVLCLYDLHFEEKAFRLEKLTDIESSFLRDLRTANPNIRVFLRIYIVGSARSLFEYVSSSTKKIAQVAAGIVRAMRREKTNGIYYDSPFNLPIKSTSGGPYDKFAALLNGYIVNKIKELLWESQALLYGLQLDNQAFEDIDFTALRLIKADGMIVDALSNPLADISLMSALAIIEEMRSTPEGKVMQFFVAIPLFSWRNGLGIKTSTAKEYLDKNGFVYKGFRNGLCLYVERLGGAQCSIPCEHYFQVVRKYAHEMNVKLAFVQAGDAIEKQFLMI